MKRCRQLQIGCELPQVALLKHFTTFCFKIKLQSVRLPKSERAVQKIPDLGTP